MTNIETPRDGSGEPVCVWCGGPVKQSGVGRRKEYCSRTHREYAYRARREAQMKLKAYTKGRADERTISSTDGSRKPRDTSVDETKVPGPPPAPAPRPVPPAPRPSGTPLPSGPSHRQRRHMLPPPPGRPRPEAPTLFEQPDAQPPTEPRG